MMKGAGIEYVQLILYFSYILYSYFMVIIGNMDEPPLGVPGKRLQASYYTLRSSSGIQSPE